MVDGGSSVYDTCLLQGAGGVFVYYFNGVNDAPIICMILAACTLRRREAVLESFYATRRNR